MTANWAAAALLAGAVLGCVEFIRPGWVIPGAAGAALFMLAIASLSKQPVSLIAAGFLAASVGLAFGAAWLEWSGWVAVVSALGACVSFRRLITVGPVHWGVAVVGGAIVLVMWRLLVFAMQARANKMV